MELAMRYSAQQQRLLDLIPKNGKPIDTKALVLGVYVPGPPPNSAMQSVMVTAKNLIKRVDDNKEDFIIKRSTQRGPYPVEFWREKRSNRRRHA